MKSLKSSALRLLFFLAICSFIILAISACHSGELSREEARKQIAAAGNYRDIVFLPLSEAMTPSKTWTVEVIDTNDTPAQAMPRVVDSFYDAMPAFELTQHLGLLEPDFQIEEKNVPEKSLVGNPWRWHAETNYHFTGKGKQIFAGYDLPVDENKFPVARKGAPAVTGMTKQSENQMLVEYEYSYEPNELGKYLDPKSAEYNSLPERLKHNLAGGANENGNPHIDLMMPQLTAPQKGQALFRRYDDGSWRLLR